ncbi:MAG: glycosyltransferase [Gammaproteobacteria bacterium]|nr:glycosyltransferase [Gammaproteobacteria bacterium]
MASIDQSTNEVTLFLANLEMGGAERVIITLSKKLVQKGHKVSLILADASGPLLNEVDPSVQIIDLKSYRAGEPSWIFGLRTLLKLKKQLERSTPNVLLTTLTGANLVALIAKKISSSKFRLVIREAAPPKNIRSLARRQLVRWLYPSADQIIALTTSMKNEMIASIGLPANKISVIGNPLDSERINELANDEQDNFEILKRKPYIISIGRLTEPKDFVTLIRATSKLPSTDINMVIIGEGPQRPMIESLIQSLNLQNRIHLLGFRSNPYPWLQAASGFVLSSRWEGHPNSLLEALHFGLPIVSTEYDLSVWSLLAPLSSEQFRIVPIGDVDALSRAMTDIFINVHTEHQNYHCGYSANNTVELFESTLFPSQPNGGGQ